MALRGQIWSVVLAGGDGKRVQGITRDAVGRPAPKQYCGFGRREPMIRWALNRAAAFSPPSRRVAVVAEHHRSYWERELADLPSENVLSQPRNRGTAIGLLLPLSRRILAEDPEATVVVLPSDHFVADEALLREGLRSAVAVIAKDPSRLVMLGVEPASPDTEYGWILPNNACGEPPWPVQAFAEKPNPETARELRGRGALLNTFIFACSGPALRCLYECAAPGLFARFAAMCDDARGTQETYNALPSLDFSRDVLAPAPDFLSVIPVPQCGWNDLGTPSRIARFLADAEESVVARTAVGTVHAPAPAVA
jgi:mannose-1-phosphate guanylyltransferase